MVIDKGKLIALLVDKTGNSKQEVEDQLGQLTDRVEEAARSGRQFHIEGFGTFGMDEGTLYFDPDNRLKTEINQKYAGMKPIELMAAFKESGAGVPVEETSGAVLPDQPVTEPDEKVAASPKKPEQKPDEPSKKPAAGKKKTEKTKEKKEKPKAAPVATKSKKPKKKKKTPLPKKKNSGSTGVLLGILLFVIILSVAGWFMYTGGVFDTSDSRSGMDAVPADSTEQVANTPADADSLQGSAGTQDSLEQSDPDDVSGNNGTASTPYGLRGSVNDETENAFTIVIHSFRLRSTVEEIADSLNQEGYRTVLFEGTANGESRWRLGLGQFRTVPDAQAVVPELSETYRESHFITRIQ